MIGALEHAEDYKAFETAITVDYDTQSAVERELVLRLANLLWRRATTMETVLFEIQANHLTEVKRGSQFQPASQEVVYALFRCADAVDVDRDPAADGITSAPGPMLSPTVEFARCLPGDQPHAAGERRTGHGDLFCTERCG